MGTALSQNERSRAQSLTSDAVKLAIVGETSRRSAHDPFSMEGPTSTSDSDESLAIDAKRGDLQKFELLVKRYQTRIVPYLEFRGFDRETAEDIFQDTCVALFRYLDTYDEKRKFGTWFYTIAIRLSKRSKQQRYRERQEDISSNESSSSDRRKQSVSCSSSAEPCAELVATESRQRFWSRIRSFLNHDEWTVIWLFYAEELSIREIGQSIERTENATKMLLTRSRRKLRKFFSE